MDTMDNKVMDSFNEIRRTLKRELNGVDREKRDGIAEGIRLLGNLAHDIVDIGLYDNDAGECLSDTIDELEERIEDLEKELESKEERITDLESDLTTRENENEELKKEVETLEEQVSSLAEELQDLKNSN